MNSLLNYIFRPGSRDKQAIKSVCMSLIRPTHLMTTLVFLIGIAFMAWTFLDPGMFNNSLLYHRILYPLLSLAMVIWFAMAQCSYQDPDKHYRMLYFHNVYLGLCMYLWTMALIFINLKFNDHIDTTIYMTVSLIIPMCIYINPQEYIAMSVLSNSAIAAMLYYSMTRIGETSETMFYNFIIFSVFQVMMGVMMLHSKYSHHKVLADESRQRKEIEKLNRAQNSFFSNMSHEIRTPINTIIGLNEMILREDVSDEVLEDAANIRSAGKLLLNLINDILDMSKFQSGSMQLLTAPYHTGDMLSDLVGMMWIRAKEKKLDLHVDVSPEIPAELIGDEMRIKQILINVVNNAIKYTKEGSVTLSVQCEMQEQNVCNMIYTVTDTGVGIKTEDIPYLFSAFRRADEGANRHIEGTGLGLSIVKQLTDLMGGKITVNSVYTKGSTFMICIPQRCESDSQIGDYDFEKNKKIGNKEGYIPRFVAPEARILVVDDNESNLLVVTKLLRDTKIRIDTASSGAEALRKTLNIRYDVIFMDHLMPEMDGIECRRQIIDQTGGRCRETSIVILTANADEQNRELYTRENFDGYLVKPVSGEELENELYRLLPKELVRITGNRSEIAEESISWMNGSRRKKRVVITTESVADLPKELLDKYEIAVLPHKVKTKEGIFKDGREIDTLGVIRYMEERPDVVLPIPPTVKEVEEFFAKNLTTANNIIHISISSEVENSGYHVATEAAASFDNVFVFDSSHLSSGQGLLAVEAARMADEGRTPEEIISRLSVLKKKVHTSFIVDNLDFLARSGQVGKRIANIVNSLMGRPVLVLRKGKMTLGMIYFGSRQRAWKKYIMSCLSSEKSIDKRLLFVTCVGISNRETDWIREQINKRITFEEVYFRQASPAISVNCGPGTFGLLLREKDKEDEN